MSYLGHVIDAEGLHPTMDKLKAVQMASAPKDVTALKSFLPQQCFPHSTIYYSEMDEGRR